MRRKRIDTGGVEIHEDLPFQSSTLNPGHFSIEEGGAYIVDGNIPLGAGLTAEREGQTQARTEATQ